MRDYEAVFILSPKLSKEAVQKFAQSLKKSIETARGEQIVEEKLEKRTLSYPIKKQTEGIYLIYKFTAQPAAVQRIKEDFKHNESVLRYAIITANKKQPMMSEPKGKEQ